ncbi:hypothetical protein DL96DRAFT_1593281 [Flagelloscypha sp. PMI_526]|nr:hypothetical protein DL96DRAFT_1593281 [Flagelloscypha sp. PMI_526]
MVLASSANGVPALVLRARSVSARVAKVLKDSKKRRSRLDGGTKCAQQHAVHKSKRARLAKEKVKGMKQSFQAKPTTSKPTPMNTPADHVDPTPPPRVQQQNGFTLPRMLDKPEERDIPPDNFLHLAPELKDADLEYVREKLHAMGRLMLRELSRVKVSNLPRGHLPKELVVQANDCPPSLLFAVWGHTPTGPSAVTLWPVHSLVFAINCANLPHLPAAISFQPPRIERPSFSDDDEPPTLSSRRETSPAITIPVIPLLLPAPAEWIPLATFLYLGDRNQLFTDLMPRENLPPDMYDQCVHPTNKAAYAKYLSETHALKKLLLHVTRIHGLWRNAVVLGIHLPGLWDCINLAWDVMMSALSYASTQSMQVERAS